MAASMLSLGFMTAVHAQTVSTLDDLSLPGANTDFISSQPAAGNYTFQSGHIIFYGTKESWGGYGAFNYTNVEDSTNPSFTNDKAAITGKGYNGSDNYGVAYLTQDYPAHPLQSLPIGAKLQGNAAGSKVTGMYLTNTTYAYLYMKDYYQTGDSLSIVIRGYLNNTVSADSVVFHLAKYTTTDTVLVNTWEWVNLVPLGNVDSLTFQVFSTDALAPYYMAFDNLTTLDGICPTISNIMATNITSSNAIISWTESIAGTADHYEIGIDQSATLAPTATAVTAAAATHAASNLTASTQYYVHVRAACPDGGFSDWDTIGFKTLQGTGIADRNQQSLQVSVSPNPAASTIYLDVKTAVNAVIYSLEGRRIAAVNHAKTIDIAALSAGTYILKVTAVDDPAQQATLRFIKNDQ